MSFIRSYSCGQMSGQICALPATIVVTNSCVDRAIIGNRIASQQELYVIFSVPANQNRWHVCLVPCHSRVND